jgi:MFS family permease
VNHPRLSCARGRVCVGRERADATIANVATPSIHADLGASGAVLELIIGGYLIAFAVLLITGARLGQAQGYRRVFLLGVGVFTLASLLCGLAPDPVTLVLAVYLGLDAHPGTDHATHSFALTTAAFAAVALLAAAASRTATRSTATDEAPRVTAPGRPGPDRASLPDRAKAML